MASPILASTTGIPTLNHAKADSEYPVFTIKKKNKKEHHLGLIPFLFGATHPIQWKGVVTVQLIGEGLYKIKMHKRDLIDEDFENGMKSANTRFVLVARRDKDLLLPLDPEKLSSGFPLRISIVFDEPRLKQIRGDPACAKAFVTGLALATPLMLGLGKGATRGFGRFATSLVDAGNLVKECPLLKTLAEYIERMDNEDAILGVFNTLATLATRAARAPYKDKTLELNIKARVISGKWTNVQVYDYNEQKFYSLVSNVKPINRALAAIGSASLKVFWKRALNMRLDESGRKVHTWLLGLPRAQKVSESCKMLLGYIILKDTKTKDMSMISWNDWKNRFKPKGGRYQSPIIMFPLPPDDEEVRIAIVALKQCDIVELVSGIMGKSLYHSAISPELKVQPCHNILLNIIKVKSILERELGSKEVNCDTIIGNPEFFDNRILSVIEKILLNESR